MTKWQRILLAVLWLFPVLAHAAPWPGEPWQQAENLTFLDDDFVRNLSGAHWNSLSRTLWVCVNAPGKFLALVEDGAGSFKVDTRNGARGEFAPGGDLESITQVDLNEQAVYLMAEGEDVIRKYDTSVYGTIKLAGAWNIHPFVPTSGGSGSEGLAFVPDAWLAKGFVDKNGLPYQSQKGMGGLMLVAHQNGGAVYAFDINPASPDVALVGVYKTSRSESSGLEFDRSSGKLWIWHNLGTNYLEVVDLTSTVQLDGSRRLKTLVEYDGPKAGNLEGIALTPASANEHGFFITDDDNQNGYALMQFRDFAPDRLAVNVRVSTSADDAEENTKGVVNLTSTDLELTRDATVQTVGMRFTSVALPPKARILRAYVQLATDEISSESTNLVIRGQAAVGAPTFVARWRNISSRAKTAASVAWSPAPWPVLNEAGAGQRTPDIGPIVQELVNLPGWQTGGPVVLSVTGTGKRIAESYNGDKNLAPLLHVEWEP